MTGYSAHQMDLMEEAMTALLRAIQVRSLTHEDARPWAERYVRAQAKFTLSLTEGAP